MKEVIMKTTICGAALLLSLTMASCEVYESPEINQGLNEENNTSFIQMLMTRSVMWGNTICRK